MQRFFLIAFVVAAAGFLWQARDQTHADVLPVAPLETTAAVSRSTPAQLIAADLEPTPVPRTQAVPILMYHYIRDLDDPNDTIGTNLSVAPETLRRHLAIIRQAGYTAVSLDELTNPNPSVTKPIVLTFDDGYADAYTQAFPLLLEFGMTGTFYVVSDFLNRDGYLTDDQVRTMAASGMAIGAHTAHHRDLTKLDAAHLTDELVASKAALEDLLARPVEDFCYPSGRLNEAVTAAVKQAGYRTATTTEMGVAQQGMDDFRLPRVRMTNAVDLEKLLVD
ncbi:polysaccharide deacetylase family protein [Candidatus Berkelbacteria bacterium]|nr:polysaccharide deacetylase family protein [Candidatus Berkelbacteria bacterium]